MKRTTTTSSIIDNNKNNLEDRINTILREIEIADELLDEAINALEQRYEGDNDNDKDKSTDNKILFDNYNNDTSFDTYNHTDTHDDNDKQPSNLNPTCAEWTTNANTTEIRHDKDTPNVEVTSRTRSRYH